MNRGIYPPLAGAITLERRLEVLSHNIGNIQTTGFKKDKPIFATVLGQTSGPSIAGIDLFPLIAGLPPDRSQGVLAHTGEALDVALQGEGFLVAQTPDGLRYYRGGKLQRNSDGNLVTHSGDPLLGKKGPIKLPPGEIVIDSAGKISVNVIDSAGKISGKNVDTLRLDQIPKGENTAKIGDLYWTVPEKPTRARETTVHQGMLEKSNVNPSLDMVELIKVTREYEQMQKAIKAMDEMASQAIQAGRVQG
ncbi:MAG: flagellar hook-basal body protein [Nitrospirota bacterium]|nr:flagellar hook-basal body protein [Nitrospirota bacterium]MDX2419571.1 flagellar hook-basal body protein [Nitrospirota bacterium]